MKKNWKKPKKKRPKENWKKKKKNNWKKKKRHYTKGAISSISLEKSMASMQGTWLVGKCTHEKQECALGRQKKGGRVKGLAYMEDDDG